MFRSLNTAQRNKHTWTGLLTDVIQDMNRFRLETRTVSPQTRPLCIWHQERLRSHPRHILENPTNKTQELTVTEQNRDTKVLFWILQRCKNILCKHTEFVYNQWRQIIVCIIIEKRFVILLQLEYKYSREMMKYAEHIQHCSVMQKADVHWNARAWEQRWPWPWWSGLYRSHS